MYLVAMDKPNINLFAVLSVVHSFIPKRVVTSNQTQLQYISYVFSDCSSPNTPINQDKVNFSLCSVKSIVNYHIKSFVFSNQTCILSTEKHKMKRIQEVNEKYAKMDALRDQL